MKTGLLRFIGALPLILFWAVVQGAEPPAEGDALTTRFVSPDHRCTLRYVGSEDSDQGRVFDVSAGKRHLVVKDYFRGGADVDWVAPSIASITVHEGVPAYHTYYYDCATQRVSSPYFMPVAFEPETRTIAAIDDDAVAFYRLYGAKPIARVSAPGLNYADYFGDCEGDAEFESSTILHVTMKCSGRKTIDQRMPVPR